MGVSSCSFFPKEIPYVNEGIVIHVNFRYDDEKYLKSIRIHDKNTLRKAIQMYQEQINKEGLDISKAVYEPDSSTLPLNSRLCNLNIDFKNIIVVYLK